MLKNNSGLIISLFVGFIISLLYVFSFTQQLELSLGYDSAFLIKKRTLPNPAIKIIGIDQKSLDMVGSFPWRRDLYANLLKILGNNPKVIGFDIILREHSAYPEDDVLLSKTLSKSKPVILPVQLEPDSENENNLNFIFPLEEFARHSRGAGLIHFFSDDDGITRRTPVHEDLKDTKERINLFALEIARTFMNKSFFNLPSTIFCNFQGKDEIFQSYSFYDVISGQVPPETFKDSIVLIGAMAEGFQDRTTTPIGPIYGVIYHAQLVSNILNNEYIVPASPTVNILLIILVSVFTYLIWKYFETINQILLIISSVLILTACHLVLFSNNIWISIVNITLANVVTFIFLILFSQFKIAKALKSELDRLILNFEKRSLRYKVYNKGTDQLNLDINTKETSSGDSNTKKVSILAEIGNTLTTERTFLETLLNNIRIAIIVTDNNSHIVLANPIAEEFFAKGEIIGKRLVDLVDSLPELKSELISVYTANKNLPAVFYGERGASMYKITMLDLENESPHSNIICLLEDVTDWHQRVNTDGLTGLWNQRYFKEHLGKEINKNQRYKTPLSLIMMDVDHFKSFNDTYGHQTGDIVLKSIAKVLQDNVRNTDIPARYGGEEFAVILPMTDEAGALIFAERVRKQIERLNIMDINGKPVRQVTSSLGIGFYSAGSVSDFIENADEALYSCKDNGRNCVIKYSSLKSELIEQPLKDSPLNPSKQVL